MLAENPVYPLPAAANLVFYHVWFMDNLWREVPMHLQWLQPGIVILALAGLGFALPHWRSFAPLLFLLAPMAAVSVKWIEIRPNLPFTPILFVLAGLCVSSLVTRLAADPNRLRARLLGLLAAGAVGGLALYGTHFWQLVRLAPSLDPHVAGAVGDLVVIAAAFGVGALLFGLTREAEGRDRALVIGFVPAALFALLFGSYAYIESEPRWRSFVVDLAELPHAVVQDIELPAPLETNAVASAQWLVDLQTDFDPPPLLVSMDGVPLAPGRFPWKRLFCNPPDPVLCTVYDRLSDFTGALPASPQWWGIRVNPRDLAGRKRVSLRLSWSDEEPRRADSRRIALGGALSPDAANAFYGPSPWGLTSGRGTSLYRWHVANDWRMWTTSPLESRATESRIAPLGAQSEDPRVNRIAGLLARGAAHFNIRLHVVYKSGRVAVY